MAKVAVMWSVWLVLLLTLSLSVCGETVHYNQELLINYARLCQQLRTEMTSRNAQMSAAINQDNEESLNIRAKVSSAIAEAFNVMQPTLNKLNDLLASAKIFKGQAVAAATSDPFEDRNLPIFNDVRLDHGMHYSPVTGEITVTQGGVYVLEFKNQPKDYQVVTLAIDVVRLDGATRYNFLWESEWEVSPYFALLNLRAGDALGIKPYKESNLPLPRVVLKPGVGNMLHLRYLGHD